MIEAMFYDGFNGWCWGDVVDVDGVQHILSTNGSQIPLNFVSIIKIRQK